MGELARKPGCPELAATPLELLTPQEGQGFSAVDRWMWPILFGAAGAFGVAMRNVLLRRPSWSGIQYHILCGGGSAYLGILIRDIRFASRSEADEAYRHYVTLHPEDFPPFERKRYKDVYERFKPVR